MQPHSSEYRTLQADSQAVFREKMSRFLAFAHPVTSAKEAREWVAAVANKYHDARHVCWAYMLGADSSEFQWNDNGEPSGTAGKPILGQMMSKNVTNLIIAVVRYFGGIKLGTSGLIAAYREAARLAIEAGTIVTAYEMANVSFTFPYIAMNSVMRTIRDSGASIVTQQFDNTCFITLAIRADQACDLAKKIAAIDGTSIQ
ncbi:MAG: YigZ family protein [Firmicutes bacterium]|nr:YigZ family protein [Bacillota bacterium]MCM1402043.1 YigZ family protein [Bacteroides sp.]MCM1476780.1 YigZ family protein [Bacteroides sp.]